MKYFLDTEFHEYRKNGVDTIELISLGIVREDDSALYEISTEFDLQAAFVNDWLRENVLRSIRYEQFGVGPNAPFTFQDCRKAVSYHGNRLIRIQKRICDFIGSDTPEFYGYFCDYDWVVFCWLFGRMIDLPKGYPMYCRELKQILDDKVASLDTDFFTDLTLEPPLTFEQKLQAAKALPGFPKQTNEHNALADARWNKALYEFLESM